MARSGRFLEVYYLNGSQVASRSSADLDEGPGASLVPAVSAYIAHRGTGIDLRFNFRGPFSHPIDGFSPYASDV